VDLNVQHFSYPSEIFHRMLEYGEWDVSEMSFAKYSSLVGRGDERFVAIPVFPSRCFRHSCVVVRHTSPLHALNELAGRRVGIPEWGQTAGVFVRGMLSEEYGLDLSSIEWLQGGVNRLGRREHAGIDWPEGVRVEPVRDRPLAHLLAGGEIDAIVAASGPDSESGQVRFRPLVDNAIAVEREYFRRTGIFPIMHVVVIRRQLHERHPWLAANLRQAFEAAKQFSLERLQARNLSLYPVPQLTDVLASWSDQMGGDPWPYGLEANRRTIEAFLRYADEQGVTGRPVASEELFVASSCDSFRN
jgi:4,5-dihydroxyphthalate decarboxylase